MNKPSYAIVRPPGDSFIRAISDHKAKNSIDPKKARRQHEDYRYLVEDLVGKMIELPKDERYPDSCFTQDTALVLQGKALIMRTGLSTRRGETTAIEKALKPLVESIDQFPAPGTIEGGDIVRLGNRLLVGRSRRTTPTGIESFKDWAEPLGYRVVPVEVPMGVLHLSTAVSVINDRLVLGLDRVLADPAFDRVSTLPVGDDPLAACNVLVIGNRIIASGEYDSHAELEKLGCTVHRPNLDEFVKADGGPTCLSLIVE